MSYLYELAGVNGQLYVDNDNVVIERKGVLGFLTQGLKGRKEIPFSSIKAVQVKEGNLVTNGYIQLSIVGGVENRRGLFDAAKDENTVMYVKQYNQLVAEIKDFIQNRMKEADSGGRTVVNQVSAADEIAKFKQLADAGTISQEEFDAKKKQLLGL